MNMPIGVNSCGSTGETSDADASSVAGGIAAGSETVVGGAAAACAIARLGIRVSVAASSSATRDKPARSLDRATHPCSERSIMDDFFLLCRATSASGRANGTSFAFDGLSLPLRD
ncbi:hypothetical protein HNR60_004318 [Rhodopseudomonas rhenobacensis]|uniref:Uncharacterized protein n=1 Tax=Rhodopseudomonas rhenobacensis TaxID=87461 RepID=A0A7W7Z7S3_9BRAD|nr:hypothetical protein [Rhodopseudomonas rhenobacensis]